MRDLNPAFLYLSPPKLGGAETKSGGGMFQIWLYQPDLLATPPKLGGDKENRPAQQDARGRGFELDQRSKI